MKKLMRFGFSSLAILTLIQPVFAESKAIAKIGDTVLTEDDLRKDMGMQLYQMESNMFNLKKSWVDQKAQDFAFDRAAKEAGISRKDWEAREIDAKVAPVDENEAQSLSGRFAKPGVDSMETIKMAKEQLALRNKQMRRMQLAQELQAKYPVQMMIDRPEAPKVNVTYSPKDPMKGENNAPVTIVEFTDFECPYCKRANDTMKEVKAAYPKQVKVVARQYPLPFHAHGKPAAEASLCAHDQGKYWDYREKLFGNQQNLSETDFVKYAKELGMNEKKFTDCLKSDRHLERIENDIKEGARFGVSGTPAFFVNGEFISGAQPFQNFKQAIDAALSKKS